MNPLLEYLKTMAQVKRSLFEKLLEKHSPGANTIFINGQMQAYNDMIREIDDLQDLSREGKWDSVTTQDKMD